MHTMILIFKKTNIEKKTQTFLWELNSIIIIRENSQKIDFINGNQSKIVICTMMEKYFHKGGIDYEDIRTGRDLSGIKR